MQGTKLKIGEFDWMIKFYNQGLCVPLSYHVLFGLTIEGLLLSTSQTSLKAGAISQEIGLKFSIGLA